MFRFTIILSLLSIVSALPATITLAYTPLSTSASTKISSPKELGILSYNEINSTYTLSSYTPPSSSKTSDGQLARIGLLPSSKSDPKTEDGYALPSTTVALLSILAQPEQAVLRIVLNADLSILSAGIGKDLEAHSTAGKTAKPRLEVVNSAPEPRPVLSRPVVLDKDGKLPTQEKPEPSLLQRYWWVLAIVLLLTLTGGGGAEGGK